jgi:dienelactone hydrolase
LRGAERALDLLATLGWLQTQPWADLDRVAVAGWSHGGWAIMDALSGVSTAAGAGEAMLPRLKTAILFYPYAGQLALTHRSGWGANRPKIYACLGGRDRVVGTAGARRAFRRLESDGLVAEVLMLPDATHSFDEKESSSLHARYRPDLAEQARAFYVDALRKTLI